MLQRPGSKPEAPGGLLCDEMVRTGARLIFFVPCTFRIMSLIP
jgi:hypothetical protein